MNGLKVKAAVLVVPGHPDNSITVYLGQGRKAGRVGTGHRLRRLRDSLLGVAADRHRRASRKTGDKWGWPSPRATTRMTAASSAGKGGGNNSLEANEADPRGIIRYASLEEFKANPGFAHEGEGHEDPRPTRACSPTGSTTITMPGACRST